MRLRDLFRSNERKSNSSIVTVLDVTTFVNAAAEKDTETLHKYLLAGFSPDQIDPISKTTALHTAVESNNFRAIQLLLQAGAQVNIADGSLSTPLHIAASLGSEEIVHILLNHGADMFLQDNTGRNAFHLAVTTGNNRLIQLFLATSDGDLRIVHTPDAQNWTPLMCACASNHPSTCALLLSSGANLCACNDRGLNIFHLLAFLGSLTILQEVFHTSIDEELLLKALNQGDQRNQTPLFYACLEGHFEIAWIYLYAGANAYHLDDDHQTCLHAMLSSSILLKRHLRLFARFIDYVDYRSFQDHLGRTLLDLADLNQLNTIRSLLVHLHYSRHYEIISTHSKSLPNSSSSVLTLRQHCILLFKRSISSQSRARMLSPRQHLENAFQCHLINTRTKSRKTRIPLDWSILINKFKQQRTSDSNVNEKVSSIDQFDHPMKNLIIHFLHSTSRLDDLLDFPSLDRHPALLDDLRTTMITYNLERVDTSNQI